MTNMIIKNKLSSFLAKTPKEMERFFSLHLNQNASDLKIVLNSVAGKYQFSSAVKTSELYDMARNFRKGFALVVKDGDKHYIDSDFIPVINEDRITTGEDLRFLITEEPVAVAKYVSSKKIFSISDKLSFDILSRQLTPEQEAFTSKRLDTIESFIAKEQLVRPSRETASGTQPVQA